MTILEFTCDIIGRAALVSFIGALCAVGAVKWINARMGCK